MTEKEFLANYNPDKYEKPSVTVDILVASVADELTTNYRKLNEKKFNILLVKRKNHPFKDKWCLPGGFIKMDETLDEAAIRVLKNETNLDNIFIEQLYTFSKVDRDPRMRVISSSYISLIDKNAINTIISKEASWFDVTYEEKGNLVKFYLNNGQDYIDFTIKKTLKELSTDRYSFEIVDNKYLAFDNPIIILSGIERLKNKVLYTDIVFNMMPKYFTLKELQQVYEIILNKKLLDPAFRRIIEDKVIKTDKVKTGGGHRPSYYYKYKGN
ncbi:MAG: NUDIX hydrolase [Bacilli bacterium]